MKYVNLLLCLAMTGCAIFGGGNKDNIPSHCKDDIRYLCDLMGYSYEDTINAIEYIRFYDKSPVKIKKGMWCYKAINGEYWGGETIIKGKGKFRVKVCKDGEGQSLKYDYTYKKRHELFHCVLNVHDIPTEQHHDIMRKYGLQP